MAKFSLDALVSDLPMLKDFAFKQIHFRKIEIANRDNEGMLASYDARPLTPEGDSKIAAVFIAKVVAGRADLQDFDFPSELAVWRQMVTSGVHMVKTLGSLEGSQTGTVLSMTASEVGQILDQTSEMRKLVRKSQVGSPEEFRLGLRRFYTWAGGVVRDLKNPLK